MRYLLAALLALLPLPALADVTARYSVGRDVLLVEIDDGGSTRIGIDGMVSIIRREGVDYAVLTPPGKESSVVKLADLLALATARADETKIPGHVLGKFILVSKGEAAVGAYKGMLWSFGPETKPGAKTERMLDIVISDDPGLAPIAAVFRNTLEPLVPVFAAVMPEASGFAGYAFELLAKGAPLRVDKLELQSIDRVEIDPKRFDLPGPVISAAEYVAAMGPTPMIEINPLP